MKTICNIITGIAAIVFFLALCSIETLEFKVIASLMISSGWLIGYGMICDELRRIREGR